MVPLSSNSTCLFELVLHKPSCIRLLFSGTYSSPLSIYNSPVFLHTDALAVFILHPPLDSSPRTRLRIVSFRIFAIPSHGVPHASHRPITSHTQLLWGASHSPPIISFFKSAFPQHQSLMAAFAFLLLIHSYFRQYSPFAVSSHIQVVSCSTLHLFAVFSHRISCACLCLFTVFSGRFWSAFIYQSLHTRSYVT